jgi:uncharacterized protein (DUF1501 family)
MNRRSVLQLMAGSAAALTGQLTPLRLANAQTPNDARLVVIVLRGGLDGLHALVPYKEERYYQLRPNIAVPAPGKDGGVLDLNGQFGLHPSLQTLHQFYQQGELLAIPAASTNYRKRSHFDAQNQLEGGAGKPYGADDGWLNRAIMELGGSDDRRLGLSVGAAPHLIMSGAAPVRTWAPSSLPVADDDFLQRLLQSYDADPELRDVLEQGIRARSMTSMQPQAKRRGRHRLDSLTKTTGQMLAAPDGPRIAVFESHGWDTHTGQAARLTRQLAMLDKGLAALKEALADAWPRTAVLVVTEFGRTVAENGSRGTDHGVGSLAFLMGGAVNGGKVLGTWPGLAENELYEGRDLAVSTDYVSIFKGLLTGHLGLESDRVNQHVFADYAQLPSVSGLVS